MKCSFCSALYTAVLTAWSCGVVPNAPLVNALNTLPDLLPYCILSSPTHMLPGTIDVGFGKKLASSTVIDVDDRVVDF